jgi:tetratricopeptide (TPR) repeat protein
MLALLLCLAAAGAPASKPAAPKLDSRLTEAFRSIKAGRYDEARRSVDAYLAGGDAAHPGQAQFIAGLSYHRQRLYESARTHFARAVELEPDYVTTWFFYGFTLYNLGRLDEARQALERFHAFSPEDAETVFGLGLVELEADRVDDAERRFLRAIALVEAKAAGGAIPAELREDLARYQARLADVYLGRDELPKARTALERSLELWPAHFEPWHKLARVLERLGDTAGAARAQAKSDEALRRRTARGREDP